MLRILVVLAALAAGYWLARRARHAHGTGTTSRALAGFALAALANLALMESWKLPELAGARPALVVAAAASGFLSWAALVWLVHQRPRRRDPYFRIPLFGLSAMTALAGAPWGVSAGFACAALLSFRWKDEFSTKALFRLGLMAVLLSVLLLLRLPSPGAEFPADDGLLPLVHFARWARFLAAFSTIAAVIALFAGFVRDPTLGIRRVGRRLALSHLLMVLIPLGLTLLLWAVTTIVGVGSERARVAAHALEREGEILGRELALALSSGAEAPASLRRTVAAWPDTGARAWWIEGGRSTRILGAPVNGDSALIGWFGASDTVPRAGIVGFGRGHWIGACTGEPGTRAAIVLVPVQPVADRVTQRFTAGHVSVMGSTDGDVVLFSGDPSLARRVDRPRGEPRVTFTLPGDTIDATALATSPPSGRLIPLGQAVSRGAALRANGWRKSPFLVSVALDPRAVLGELFARAGRQDIDLLPLILVLFFGTLFALVAAFDVAMVVNMARSITASIGALRRGATQLEAGDLAHRIPVAGEDELWDVARAFNQAIGGLERARDLEKERVRLENELELARRIQSHLLPASAPIVEGWQIAGASESARQVGGDYFDHLDLGGGRLVLVIADVSGKGVPAAMLMSAFRAALMSQDLSGVDPSALAGRLNGFLHQSVEPGRFVTAFVGFLDLRSGRMLYVNAGHNPPYLVRRSGREEPLSEGGTILGILPQSLFAAGEATLEPGDLLALYTDGVTEGANAEGDMWGEERLVEALRHRAADPAAQIVQGIIDEVRAFEGDSGPADDITLLIAKRLAGDQVPVEP